MPKTPNHIAIIMDGNGRWAKSNNKPRIFGHKAGVKRVREIVKHCRNNKDISVLTLYTFSSENWTRPKLEIKALMNLIKLTIDSEIDDLIENGIKVNIIGDISQLPKSVFKKLQESMYLTENDNKLVLNLAINYGSRQELVNVVRLISEELISNKVNINDINEELLESKLYTYPYPPPDLLIRTGGEFRLSNFLLWQVAYTEIVLNEKHWPDYTESDFKNDIGKFRSRERRFGKTK